MNERLKALTDKAQRILKLQEELENLGLLKPKTTPAVKFTLEEDGRVFVSFNGGMPIEAGANKNAAIEFAEKLTGKKIRIKS